MTYYVIYDGNCNLCSTFVQALEQFDQGRLFRYASMQDQATLTPFGITAADCEKGMILLDAENPTQRWQGSEAAEKIGQLLPVGDWVVPLYRMLPGLKWVGDRIYEQVRDHRYAWFGRREQTYKSKHPVCSSGQCQF